MTSLLWTLVFLSGMAFFNFQIWGRMKVLLKARRDDGRDYSQKTWIPRLKNTLIYGLGQFKFLKGDQPAGILHIFIFWGFITLGLQVMTMFIRGWMPDFILPGLHADQLGKFYALTKDILSNYLIAVGAMIGGTIAIIFSISMAMACASKVPIIIGSFLLPFFSSIINV
jgi:hypothetical protein